MTEGFTPHAEGPPSTEQRLDDIRDQLLFLSGDSEDGHPNAPDRYMQAFYGRFYGVLFEDERPNTRALARQVLDRQPDMSSVNFANASMRVGQDFKLRNQCPAYPKNHDTAEAWDDFFDAIESDGNARWAYELRMTFNVQSNISGRGLPPRIIALADGYDSPIRILDVGCSRHRVMGKWALVESNPDFSYDYVDVMRRPEHDAAEPMRDLDKTIRLNQVRRMGHLPLKLAMGIDRWELLESTMKTWAKSCSFYPSELLGDMGRVQEFDYLEKHWPINLRFHCDDFAYFQHDAFEKKFPNPEDREYDMVLFSTILYQLGSQQIQQMLENARHYVKPDGLIVVQDFIEQINGRGEMTFAPKWSKWTYGVWMQRMLDAEAGFQKYLTLDSGRAKQWIFEPTMAKLTRASEFGLIPSAA